MLQMGEAYGVHRPQHQYAQHQQEHIIAPGPQPQIAVEDVMDQAKTGEKEVKRPGKGEDPQGAPRGEKREEEPRQGQEQFEKTLARAQRHEIAPGHGAYACVNE